jgi:hypothetical protein
MSSTTIDARWDQHVANNQAIVRFARIILEHDFLGTGIL